MEQQSPRKQVRVGAYIPEDDHRRLKAIVALAGISVTEWIRRKVKDEIGK
jgi:predicted HicB family RNase H-like nuclease